MTKYKQYFDKMIEENREVFKDFRLLHDRYAFEGDGMQDEFNEKGKKILNIIREYENKLCKNSEKTYSMFAGNLAEKFWIEVRKEFPMVDHIGIITKKPAFSLKKITLN